MRFQEKDFSFKRKSQQRNKRYKEGPNKNVKAERYSN